MKRNVWAVVAIVLVVLGIAGFAVKSLLVKNTPEKSVQTASQVKSTEEKVASPVKVVLPGASSIDALKEDYGKSSSLWVVVSKDFQLADLQYRPTDLVVPSVTTNSAKTKDEQSVSGRIQPSLEALFASVKTAGYDLMVASGFRSYDLQQQYFTSYSAAYGETAANKFSARPGQSEHQTGLSLDISYVDRSCYLDTCFGEKPAGMWLATHAWEYGFILRYPADKTEITKYQYEPWHFRYVGKDLAKALHQSGLTLDEAKPYLDKADAELKTRAEI